MAKKKSRQMPGQKTDLSHFVYCIAGFALMMALDTALG